MDRDEAEDFIFFGTPIQREEEITTRKKKSVAESSGTMRALPSWKQEVRDEEGRRRFHGAFTGGYSAGYYNTAGSKEGWTPQTFTSSRKSRAERKEQDVLSFMDDDEKAEMEGQFLGTSLEFDTFGFKVAELARKDVEKEQQKRPSAIPGSVPDEIILPATNSIGLNLLLKMGWRHGHSISDSRSNSLYDARREARKAFLALSSDDKKIPREQFEFNESDSGSAVYSGTAVEQPADNDLFTSQSTPVFVVNPKQDLYGLGYDPYKHHPECRDKKRLRLSGNLESGSRKSTLGKNLFKSGNAAPGFGIGALEEPDVEDDDIYAATSFDFDDTIIQDIEEPSGTRADSKLKLLKYEEGVLPGFTVASNIDNQVKRFSRPVIPSGFKPYHKFPSSIDNKSNLTGPPPPEVPPPDDNSLKLMIDGFSTLVARCGKLFEDLSREKNKTNPLFCFLNGGKGDDYYKRKVWEEQQKRKGQAHQLVDLKLVPSVQKMTAETRGKVLGEKPLERRPKDASPPLASSTVTHVELNLSDTFTKPASLSEIPEAAKPFKTDPAKQERFERFLKEKYQGGLRSVNAGGSSHMSEADRAHERLDFEAAAEAIGKLELDLSAKKNQQLLDTSAMGNMQFTAGGLEQTEFPQEHFIKQLYPKREDYPWRPSSLLCKRFDIIDPYIGKPAPLPRARSRMDSFIFTSDFIKPTKSEEKIALNMLQSKSQEPQETRDLTKEEYLTKEETGIDNGDISIERPVDLYKAIFSDDSEDEEEENDALNQVKEPLQTNEVANSNLNRLIAGDFLESLGKELGLEVPREPSLNVNKVDMMGIGNAKIPSDNTKLDPVELSSGPSKYANVGVRYRELTKAVTNDKNDKPETPVLGMVSTNPVRFVPEKMVSDGKIDKYSSRRHYSRGVNEISDDEGSKKHSKRSRNRSTSPSSEDDRKRRRSKRYHGRNDTSSDSEASKQRRHNRHSSSKSERRSSSQGKSGSKKHSKYHKSSSKDSHSKHSRHDY